MTDQEPDPIDIVFVRQLAQRDILIRLLAVIAGAHADPAAFLDDFSEQGTIRANKKPQTDRQAMRRGEAIQDEWDKIVANAKALLAARR